MPRSKKESPFWNPKKSGESISGKFVHFEQTSFGGKAGDRHGVAMRLTSNPPLIGLTYVLTSILSPIRKKIKAGDEIKVRYDGEGGKSKYGKPVKRFTVWWKGKELEQTTSFGKPMSEKELDEFFPPF